MLRSEMVLSRQKEELSGEPQMVNDEKLRSEISRKDCIEFVKTLQNFNSYVYQEFVHLMKDFKIEGDDCIKALKQKVKELFEGHPDLILGFNAFLPKRHRINVPIQVKVQTSRKLPIVLSRKRKRCDDASDVYGAGSNDSKLQKVIDFVNKVKDRFHHHDNEEGEDVFQSFLDIFLTNHRKRNKLSPNRNKLSPSKSITAVEEDELHIYKKVEELFEGHPDLIDEFTNFLPTIPFPSLSSVIDFDNCETCTPSYRLLPENFPIPAATKRSKLASQVLNDRWVCVPSTTSRGGGGGG
uniref:paired amphipathic helix protein Sin3-like 2 n=1 Tax=Fragaria vesca subsp. vesca TaxID=101020 RepID=UPI0005C8A1B7